jgi:hypothetical protein
MGKPQTTIAVVILAIVAIASGEYAMVIGHYLAQFDGVVVTRTDDVHFPPWTRNRANRYVIRESDGSEHIYYADSAEGRNGFPIGTRIAKQRWRMGYKENGQARSDFPLDIYILPMMIDAVLLLGCRGALFKGIASRQQSGQVASRLIPSLANVQESAKTRLRIAPACGFVRRTGREPSPSN